MNLLDFYGIFAYMNLLDFFWFSCRYIIYIMIYQSHAIRGVILRIRNGSGLLKRSSFSRKNTSSLATITAPPIQGGQKRAQKQVGFIVRGSFCDAHFPHHEQSESNYRIKTGVVHFGATNLSAATAA